MSRKSRFFRDGGPATAEPTSNGTASSANGHSKAGASKLALWLAEQKGTVRGGSDSLAGENAASAGGPVGVATNVADSPPTEPLTAPAGPTKRDASPTPAAAPAPSVAAEPDAAPARATVQEAPAGIVFRVDVRTAFKFGVYALLIVLQAAAVGYAVSAQRTDVYGARTEILFPLDADRATGFLREDRRISTQLESIRSRAVLGPVAERHGMQAEDLRENVDVSVVGASEIIRIEVHDRDPNLAQALSADIAAEYLAQVEEDGVVLAEAVLGAELVTLEGRLAEIEVRIAAIDESRRALPPTEASSIILTSLATEESRLLAESSSLFSRIGEIRGEMTALEVERALAPRPVVLADSYVLDRPVSPLPIRDAALAAALGATVAAVVLTVLLVGRSADPRAGD